MGDSLSRNVGMLLIGHRFHLKGHKRQESHGYESSHSNLLQPVLCCRSVAGAE